MNDSEPSTKFWIGNGVLAVALLMLLFMEYVWSLFGSATMVIWVVLVGIGIYFLMNDKSEPPSFPG